MYTLTRASLSHSICYLHSAIPPGGITCGSLKVFKRGMTRSASHFIYQIFSRRATQQCDLKRKSTPQKIARPIIYKHGLPCRGHKQQRRKYPVETISEQNSGHRSRQAPVRDSTVRVHFSVQQCSEAAHSGSDLRHPDAPQVQSPRKNCAGLP